LTDKKTDQVPDLRIWSLRGIWCWS